MFWPRSVKIFFSLLQGFCIFNRILYERQKQTANYKEANEMKLLKKGKKALIITLTAAMLSGGLAAPVMAHGHGGGHHASTGVSSSHHETDYHETAHHNSSVSTKKSTKGYYCAYHCKNQIGRAHV